MNINTLIPQKFEIVIPLEAEIENSNIVQPIIPTEDTPILDDKYLMASSSVVLSASDSEALLWTSEPQILKSTL